MASLRTLTQGTSDGSAHPTEVDAIWRVLQSDNGGRIFQLDTFGSDHRQSHPKVSQTFQINEARAGELLTALRATFPNLK